MDECAPLKEEIIFLENTIAYLDKRLADYKILRQEHLITEKAYQVRYERWRDHAFKLAQTLDIIVDLPIKGGDAFADIDLIVDTARRALSYFKSDRKIQAQSATPKTKTQRDAS